MSNHYITAAEHLPDEERTETTLQITDAETKRIFEARVRIASEPDELTDPRPLRVVTGPHENVSEERYIELIDEIDSAGVNEDLLRRLASEQETASNIVNTRSDDLKVVLRYLVESGQYESTAEALRELAFQHLAENRPALLETYEEVRTEFEADPLRRALTDGE
ncbi:ubiD operon protein [Natrinema sp. 1APR25-10V2]|uniref:ubiD operon protein n=1 Tax=Natrinema sp. 1APR25-10V2 TaxID=2951081 RepID=UPI002876460E|nr:ubiD operon protein [Natrinema sp. 1APR25-10V2]MDS0477738.1 ubiD operon protein [Natrinema sp. 1APR25-10V2]